MTRILLVDDETVWLDLTGHRLEHLGFDVVPVKEGVEAFRLAAEERFDLAILDIKMPLNGRALFRFLKSQDPPVPVIVHSAYERYRDDAFLEGMEAFIVKSTDPAPLLETVLDAIEGPPSPSPDHS